MPRSRRGFILIELFVVLVVLSAFAIVARQEPTGRQNLAAGATSAGPISPPAATGTAVVDTAPETGGVDTAPPAPDAGDSGPAAPAAAPLPGLPAPVPPATDTGAPARPGAEDPAAGRPGPVTMAVALSVESTWPDIEAAGGDGAVEVAWKHESAFTSYTVRCTGGSPQPLFAIRVDPASQFWANYGAAYQSMGYDVATFTAPAAGAEIDLTVRQPGPADALPFEHTCRVTGYPDVDTPAVYEMSNPATATPTPGPGYVPPPATPTGLVATATGPTTVDLAWDELVSPPEIPFDGYRLYVDGDAVAEIPATEPALTYTAGGLPSGIEHTFGVSSFGSGGESEPVTVTATPMPIAFASGLLGVAAGPRGMAFDASGNLYVAVPDADNVAKVTPAGTVSTLTDEITSPLYVAVDGAGDVFVADASGAVSRVTPAGVVSGFASGFGDVRGLAFDSSGDLYVASAPGSVSKVTPSAEVTTVLTGYDDLQAIAVDSAGGGYLAEATGTVIKIPGASFTIVAWAAPLAMAFDPDGNLYLAEANDTVYMVTADGNTVTTVAGGFTSGVRAVAFRSGYLYVASGDGTIVKVG